MEVKRKINNKFDIGHGQTTMMDSVYQEHKNRTINGTKMFTKDFVNHFEPKAYKIDSGKDMMF